MSQDEAKAYAMACGHLMTASEAMLYDQIMAGRLTPAAVALIEQQAIAERSYHRFTHLAKLELSRVLQGKGDKSVLTIYEARQADSERRVIVLGCQINAACGVRLEGGEGGAADRAPPAPRPPPQKGFTCQLHVKLVPFRGTLTMADLLQFPERVQLDRQDDLPELLTDWPLFCDWLTIRQVHSGGLPKVSDGWLTSCDANGQIEYELVKRSELEGSFDSRSFLRCDGNVVEFHGNVARYGRRDNVFGYTWPETIRRVNDLLNLHSLPPFTSGELMRYADTGWEYTGARVSRIDMTVNYAAFSERDAHAVLLKLGQRHTGRQVGTVMPDASTVTFGYGSKYASGKVYLKHVELEKHLRTKHGSHVDNEVIDFCKTIGMLREEITLKSRFLTQNGLCWLAQLSTEELMRVYLARSQIRGLNNMEVSDTAALSAAARGTLARWENGESHGLKRTAYYRHRREILSCVGVDISVPRNVTVFKQPVKVVEIQALVAPDWYRRKYG